MSGEGDGQNLVRCPWVSTADTIYVRYHDEEWGVPQSGDRALFEKLILEGFQSGLSWLTILRKRDNFRRAFDGFDPAKIAHYGDADIARLMADPGIVRNRLKIEAAVGNAKAFLGLAERQSFASFLWGFLENGPIVNHHSTIASIPPQTELSLCISKALKSIGFCFVGPTTVYALMQSVGMINDHLVSCHRHAACAKLQRQFRGPKP